MVQVLVTNNHPTRGIVKSKLVRYVERVIKSEGHSRASVSVVCIGGPKMRALNRRFLRHDYTTDVLSFPLSEEGRCEGEIYLNLDKVNEQAREYGVSPESELARLVIHGTLHLVGYDDATAKDRAAMKSQEDSHVCYWFPKNSVGSL